MSRCQDRELAIQKIVESNAAVEGGCSVVVSTIEAIQGLAKCSIYSGVDPEIDIECRVDVSDRHDPGVLEWNAEIEDVGMRVKRIVWSRDHFPNSGRWFER